MCKVKITTDTTLKLSIMRLYKPYSIEIFRP